MDKSFKTLKTEHYMYSFSSSTPPKLELHTHKYYELLYLIEGDISYLIGDRLYKAAPGDIFITPPNQEHGISFNSEANYARHFIQVSPELLSSLPKELHSNFVNNLCSKYNRIPSEIVKKYNLGSYFYSVQNYLSKESVMDSFMFKTYALQLIALTNTITGEEITSYFSEKPMILEIKDYIMKNIEKQLSLDTLAANFFMSKYYMCHTFRNETGMTIKNYINLQRVARARELLLSGSTPADIPKMCGFNDYSTFYRTFKKYTGYSPTDIKA